MQDDDACRKVEEVLNGGSFSMQGWPPESAPSADVDVSMAIASRQHLLPPTALVPLPASHNIMHTVASDSQLSSPKSQQWSSQQTPVPAALTRLRSNIIGRTSTFTSPFGQRSLVPADSASCCRPLQPLEDYIGSNVSPWYLTEQTSRNNSKLLSAFMRDARESIVNFAGARREEYAVIFAGHSASAATAKMAQLLGVLDTTLAAHQPVIIHCTTEDPAIAAVWRDVSCQHVVVPTDSNGQPDLRSVREALIMHSASPLVVGFFSLGCPVTGVVADVRALSRLLHEFGAVAAFDYTNAGATLTVPCTPPGGMPDPAEQVDAVVMAPSQLAGGVGAAGVLVIRRNVIQVAVPESTGWHGDTYTNSNGQPVDNFIADIEEQEGGDQHNMMGIIRAGIASQLHMDMKPNIMHSITREYTSRALNAWRSVPGLWLLGEGQGGFNTEERLPVISFNVLVKAFHPVDETRGSGCMILHHSFVAAVLSDIYGIQVSVGNAFDGPNGFEHIHDTLVNVCGHGRDALEQPLSYGLGWVQPGWVQVRFSHLMTSREVDLIIRAVMEVGQDGWKLLPQYDCSVSTGQFTHYTEGSMKQGNAMQRASQQILSPCASQRPSEGSRLDTQPEPDSPPAELGAQDPSDMSYTNCLSLASSGGGYPRSTIRGLFQSLLCRSGSWHSPSGSSRSLPQSVQRMEDTSRVDTSALSTSGMSATESGAVDGRGHLHRRGSSGGDTLNGLESSRTLASEPRLTQVQPDKFVLEGGTAGTAWERDMRAEGTAYVHWARCPFRWFLLQHEAASALRMHASLAL